MQSNIICHYYAFSDIYNVSNNIVVNETTTLEELERNCSDLNVTISYEPDDAIDAFVAIAMAASAGNLNLLSALITKCGNEIITKCDVYENSLLNIVTSENRLNYFNTENLYEGVKKTY